MLPAVPESYRGVWESPAGMRSIFAELTLAQRSETRLGVGGGKQFNRSLIVSAVFTSKGHKDAMERILRLHLRMIKCRISKDTRRLQAAWLLEGGLLAPRMGNACLPQSPRGEREEPRFQQQVPQAATRLLFLLPHGGGWGGSTEKSRCPGLVAFPAHLAKTPSNGFLLLWGGIGSRPRPQGILCVYSLMPRHPCFCSLGPVLATSGPLPLLFSPTGTLLTVPASLSALGSQLKCWSLGGGSLFYTLSPVIALFTSLIMHAIHKQLPTHLPCYQLDNDLSL